MGYIYGVLEEFGLGSMGHYLTKGVKKFGTWIPEGGYKYNKEPSVPFEELTKRQHPLFSFIGIQRRRGLFLRLIIRTAVEWEQILFSLKPGQVHEILPSGAWTTL